MPTFNSYPALQAQTFDLPAIMEQAQRLKSQRTTSRLQEFDLQQRQAKAGRQEQLRGILPEVAAGFGFGESAQQAVALDPSMMGTFSKMSKAQREQTKEKVGTLGNLALSVLTAPPVQRTAMWGQARQVALATGVDPSKVPESYSADVEERLRLWVGQAGKIKTLLDQMADTPSGYRSTEGGLEFIPGGPADPVQARKLRAASGDTALQKDVPYIAKLLGINKKEALALKMESKGKGYDAYLRDIAARYVSASERPQRAYDKAKAVADLVYGRAQPPEAKPDSKEGRSWLQELFGFGGPGETGSAKAAKRGSRGNPHTPETLADFDGIKSGEIYRDPDDQKLYRKPSRGAAGDSPA